MGKQCYNCGKPIEEDAFRCIACFSRLWFGHVKKEQNGLPTNKQGNIYFIADEHEHIKIGFAIDPEERLKAFQNSNADKLTILLVIPGTYQKEKRLHRKFAHLRIRNTEWFRRAPEIIEFIRAPAHIAKVGLNRLN